jgi:ribosomal protein S27AE
MNEIMIAEYPVKVIDEETTFKKTNFYCLRCGTPDIVKKDNIKYFAERQNFHPRGKSAFVDDVETTFFVTASLYCARCKHTYFLKILDEVIK